MSSTNTMPAGDGAGIDLSGIDVAAAIFKATGGLYGSPHGGSAEGLLFGAPANPDIWVTNTGSPWLPEKIATGFDPSVLGDPDATIKYTTDPVTPDHPLITLMTPEETPHFANGGAEGVGCVPIILGAVAIVGAAALAGAYLAGAFDGDGKATEDTPKRGMQKWEDTHNEDGSEKRIDPDASAGDPMNDTLVLKQLLGDLLGTDDFAALALDEKAFGAAVGNIVQALMDGKLGTLGELITKIEDSGVDIAGFAPGEAGVQLASPVDILDQIPFAMDLDAMAVMLDPAAMVVTDFVNEGHEQQVLLVTHDIWW